MKKALLPAVLLLCIVSAAHAQSQPQVSLYGLIDMSYGKSTIDDYNYKKPDFHSGGDNGSGEGNSTTRFGIKGSADVGSGIKANFKLESGGITSDGEVNPGGAFFNRQAWLGFSNQYGEVRLGRQESVPYQTLLDFDFNGVSNGLSSSVVAATPSRQSRSLQYISPTVSGFKAQVGFVPEGNETSPVTHPKDTLSGGVTYAAGPISAGATFETKRTEDASNFFGLASAYDFGVAKVALGFVKQGSPLKAISLGVTAPVAGATVGAQFLQNNGDVKSHSWEVFANKEVLKNTTAYAEVGQLKYNDADKTGTGFAVGLIYVF